jgi:hypothetical protein
MGYRLRGLDVPDYTNRWDTNREAGGVDADEKSKTGIQTETPESAGKPESESSSLNSDSNSDFVGTFYGIKVALLLGLENTEATQIWNSRAKKMPVYSDFLGKYMLFYEDSGWLHAIVQLIGFGVFVGRLTKELKEIKRRNMIGEGSGVSGSGSLERVGSTGRKGSFEDSTGLSYWAQWSTKNEKERDAILKANAIGDNDPKANANANAELLSSHVDGDTKLRNANSSNNAGNSNTSNLDTVISVDNLDSSVYPLSTSVRQHLLHMLLWFPLKLIATLLCAPLSALVIMVIAKVAGDYLGFSSIKHSLLLNWYGNPPLILPLYVFPGLALTCLVWRQGKVQGREKGRGKDGRGSDSDSTGQDYVFVEGQNQAGVQSENLNSKRAESLLPTLVESDDRQFEGGTLRKRNKAFGGDDNERDTAQGDHDIHPNPAKSTLSSRQQYTQDKIAANSRGNSNSISGANSISQQHARNWMPPLHSPTDPEETTSCLFWTILLLEIADGTPAAYLPVMSILAILAREGLYRVADRIVDRLGSYDREESLTANQEASQIQEPIQGPQDKSNSFLQHLLHNNFNLKTVLIIICELPFFVPSCIIIQGVIIALDVFIPMARRAGTTLPTEIIIALLAQLAVLFVVGVAQVRLGGLRVWLTKDGGISLGGLSVEKISEEESGGSMELEGEFLGGNDSGGNSSTSITTNGNDGLETNLNINDSEYSNSKKVNSSTAPTASSACSNSVLRNFRPTSVPGILLIISICTNLMICLFPGFFQFNNWRSKAVWLSHVDRRFCKRMRGNHNDGKTHHNLLQKYPALRELFQEDSEQHVQQVRFKGYGNHDGPEEYQRLNQQLKCVHSDSGIWVLGGDTLALEPHGGFNFFAGSNNLIDDGEEKNLNEKVRTDLKKLRAGFERELAEEKSDPASSSLRPASVKKSDLLSPHPSTHSTTVATTVAIENQSRRQRSEAIANSNSISNTMSSNDSFYHSKLNALFPMVYSHAPMIFPVKALAKRDKQKWLPVPEWSEGIVGEKFEVRITK